MLIFLVFITRHINGGRLLYGNKAYVGLALPGDLGSWQRQGKVFLLLKSSL